MGTKTPSTKLTIEKECLKAITVDQIAKEIKEKECDNCEMEKHWPNGRKMSDHDTLNKGCECDNCEMGEQDE